MPRSRPLILHHTSLLSSSIPLTTSPWTTKSRCNWSIRSWPILQGPLTQSYAVIRRVSITSLWDETRPEEAGEQSVQEYLQDTYVNTNFHDYYYYSTDEFRKTYQERYHKRPYVVPFIDWKWELGRPVTQAQRNEGMHRLEVYKKWFLDSAMQQAASEAYLIMPISDVIVNYRDAPPAPVARPNGFDPLILSPILGAPDIVVPIGEYEYDSRVSGRKEYLPVAVDVVGLPGSDLHLIDIIQHSLEMSHRPAAVNTGSRMFNADTWSIFRDLINQMKSQSMMPHWGSLPWFRYYLSVITLSPSQISLCLHGHFDQNVTKSSKCSSVSFSYSTSLDLVTDFQPDAACLNSNVDAARSSSLPNIGGKEFERSVSQTRVSYQVHRLRQPYHQRRLPLSLTF